MYENRFANGMVVRRGESVDCSEPFFQPSTHWSVVSQSDEKDNLLQCDEGNGHSDERVMSDGCRQLCSQER